MPMSYLIFHHNLVKYHYHTSYYIPSINRINCTAAVILKVVPLIFRIILVRLKTRQLTWPGNIFSRSFNKKNFEFLRDSDICSNHFQSKKIACQPVVILSSFNDSKYHDVFKVARHSLTFHK